MKLAHEDIRKILAELKPLKAPPDFLIKVHEKIGQESWWRKALLYYPAFRVAAGVLAVFLIVILIAYPRSVKNRITLGNPGSSEPVNEVIHLIHDHQGDVLKSESRPRSSTITFDIPSSNYGRFVTNLNSIGTLEEAQFEKSYNSRSRTRGMIQLIRYAE